MRDPPYRLAPFVLSFALWAVLFAAVPPAAQDFPYNDDWAFSRGAFDFARGEGIHSYGWPEPLLLGQWLWSAPFVRLLGANHVSLRLSVIALSWLTLAALYDLARRAGATPAAAALAASALAVDPLFLLLSNSYMTDVPALALGTAALAAFVRGGVNRDGRWWAAGCAAALVGVLSRQTVAAAPLAALLLSPGCRSSLAALGVVAAGVLADVWRSTRPDAVAHVYSIPPPARVLWILFYALTAAGLAAAPVLAARAAPGRRRAFLVALTWLSFLGVIRLARGGLWPYVGNNLNTDGAFVSLLGEHPVLLGPGLRAAATVCGPVAGAALLVRLARPFPPVVRILLAYSGLHLMAYAFRCYPFDRYYIVVYPLALVLAARATEGGRLRLSAGLALLAASALFSTAFVHDHLAWNAARWALGRRAVASGIDPQAIEGGFEWDGHFAPGGAVRNVDVPTAGRGLALPAHLASFPGMTGRYALSFTPLPGSVVIDSEPYRSWLAPGDRRILLLAAGDSAAGSAIP